MASTEAVLSLKGITLDRNNNRDLDEVNLEFFPGTIHCVLGKYGSGKSSLVQIIRGSKKPTGGRIVTSHTEYSQFRIKEALNLGIAVIQHDDRFIDNMKVKEFLFEKFYHNNSSIISSKKMNQNLNTLKDKYKIDDYGDLPLGRIPVSDKFYLSIVKNINQTPRIFILDEILDKLNTSHLAKTIQLLKEHALTGMSVVLITNNIDEVYNIAERVSILKNGRVIYNDDIKKIEKINLIKLAYIEISKSDQDKLADRNFYQLLKYNEAILLELPINLLIVDNEMIVKIANKSAKNFFSFEENDYFNQPLVKIFRGNIHAFDLIQDAFTNREATLIHNLVLTFGEENYHTDIKTNPIFDGPVFIGFIIAIEDVTEQEDSRKKLFMTENLASVGLLSAGVAHEINNPLEIISNCVSFLSYHIDKEELQEKIETINSEVNSISKIISNLVGITHQKTYTSEVFNLNEMILNLIDLLNQNALNQRIKINFANTGEMFFIKADITEIKQVLLNIIKNSIEAINGEGSIDIHMSRFDDNFVEIVIEDSGTGIDEDLIKNIFLPFYSNKHTGKQNQGLGLYISYSIVKKYNGNIIVKNMNNGCRFSITLPVLKTLD